MFFLRMGLTQAIHSNLILIWMKVPSGEKIGMTIYYSKDFGEKTKDQEISRHSTTTDHYLITT